MLPCSCTLSSNVENVTYPWLSFIVWISGIRFISCFRGNLPAIDQQDWQQIRWWIFYFSEQRRDTEYGSLQQLLLQTFLQILMPKNEPLNKLGIAKVKHIQRNAHTKRRLWPFTHWGPTLISSSSSGRSWEPRAGVQPPACEPRKSLCMKQRREGADLITTQRRAAVQPWLFYWHFPFVSMTPPTLARQEKWTTSLHRLAFIEFWICVVEAEPLFDILNN